MADKLIVFYPHRRNRDGSFDSICLNCFATLATAKTEADLLELDKRHICQPATVSQRAFDRKLLQKESPH
jgi:hypothetical protein